MSHSYLLRMEPRNVAGSLEPGLAARVADPLWMLGRQWQLGELLAEDAGSPTSVDLAAETAKVARFRRVGEAVGVPYDPAAMPLDVMAADEVRQAPRWTVRLRVDTGRAFARLLREAGMGGYSDALRTAHALEPAPAHLRVSDPAGARLLDVASGRIADGQQLYEALEHALRTGSDLPASAAIVDVDVDAIRKAGNAWLAFCDATITESGPSTWVPERLAHGFSVATGDDAGASVLDADGVRGPSIDWYSFDSRPVAKATGFTALPPPSPLPTGVRFRGMPNARWWELEDSSIDLGAVDAGPSDVARLALLEFTLVYANDFFAVPLRLPVGSLCRINSLVVHDTFGMKQRIEPAGRGPRQGSQRWTMFTFTERAPGAAPSGVSDMFFLPPVAVQPITGSPVEDVLLLRDEMANLAWAVERRYEGDAGGSVEAIEAMTRSLVDTGRPNADAPLRYLLGMTVPAHWFPLVPTQNAAGVLLDLQRMANQDASVEPRGRILDLNGPHIVDAEVPREGTRLLRDYAMARWSNGESFTWARRTRLVGRGEGSSGLRFDAAVLENENPV